MKTLSNYLKDEDRHFRINFFNTLSGVRSVWMVGTQSKAGVKNLGLFNSLVHIGANPPLLGLIFRPHSVPRHTLENINESGLYTLNSVTSELMHLAHRTAEKFEAHEDEFELLGFTPWYFGSYPNVPAVAESPLKILLRYVEKHLIAANQTQLLVGEVIDVHIKVDAAVQSDGSIDHQILGHLAVSGLNDYYALSHLLSMSRSDD
ncbi:flavin oxidoreductase [Thermaurantimonas aggregans]|uniref:Flavin oxidoreductase n=1 Tax=Thermaurantimonas aggregans TaxID=2173829 RepID=A0A401XNF6_9FLAO|nr:flavin reductase [Thermaurantimonas aggregans]MCX8147641.1 flavin reductase [Thermaurantimonas aggregans]GCD78556.1 flavin oxidoreductase [Thermaurantimonas aggregans]